MPRAALVLTAGALAASACGASREHTHTAASPLARAQATHEYPSPPPRPQSTTSGSATPLGAIRAFATAYINWDAQSVAADMRALALASIGQARATTILAAAQTAGDYELERGGIANHGTVEAVA